ncbi:hypothetical protein ZEAMMB73_Zm00001d020940 [Zea mays]|jgi:hypothetical protein|uniref:Uncharacterized protein n=1 Tax=Zea mays TaxID=4577 RepID=A0A1D6I6Z7_MAIZE|nr:hypothetical protein ZEAMMB73_Zm00001d020940 [Zea mays]
MSSADKTHGSHGAWSVIDEAFMKAPPSDDPACSVQVDAVAYRETIQTWVEDLRAKNGARPLSAAMYRRRRALNHCSVALEFAQRRRVAVGLEDDELCRSVQAAMDTQVVGSCAYCGCNFSVVAVVAVGGLGMACGVCFRLVRVYNPVPLVRNPPANAEERWKGWLPW